MVSGQVTRATEIECEPDNNKPADNANQSQPTATKSDHGSDDSSSGPGSGDDGMSNTQAGSTQLGEDRGNDQAGDADNEPGENPGADQGKNEAVDAPGQPGANNPAPQACDSSALKSGVVVTRARLRESGTQLVFKPRSSIRSLCLVELWMPRMNAREAMGADHQRGEIRAAFDAGSLRLPTGG